VKRIAKASSAGSTTRQAKGLGRIFRGVFATRGASGGADGSGAPSRRLRHGLLAALAAAFVLLPASSAWADGAVEVSVIGEGTGTVTSSSVQKFFGFPSGSGVATPGQIDCDESGGPICSTYFESEFEGFPADYDITLTATADPGFVFVGWEQSGATATVAGCTTPPGEPDTCEFRLNGSPGPTAEVTAKFVPPPEPPIAITDGATAGVTDHLMTLEGQVNPNTEEPVFVLSKCRFAYGPTTAYGESAPCVPDAEAIGVGTSFVPVTASTAPLEPETTYHYRLLATGPAGTVQGRDRTFTTGPAAPGACPNAAIRAAQGILVRLLPDCLALEQVSPPRKGNQPARLKSPRISPDGGRVVFNSVATLGGCPNVNGSVGGGDSFIASRGAAGWDTECANPPISEDIGSGLAQFSFTPDLSRYLQFISTTVEEGPKFVQEGLGGHLRFLSPGVVGLNGVTNPEFRGASADHSRLYFTPQANRDRIFLPGDPEPAGTGEDFNLYVTGPGAGGEPVLELAARDKDGKVWGGRCGARLGGSESTNGIGLNLPMGPLTQGAISPDGSRAYISTRPDQPEGGSCAGGEHKKRIMVREETPAGVEIHGLIESECDRVAPACSAEDGDDAYLGASLDQTKVYFETNRQLADTDLDGTGASCVGDSPPSKGEPAVPGCDIYVYDSTEPAGQRLTQVSAGEDETPGEGADVKPGIAAISADGSHVYFVAEGVLTETPNSEGQTATEGKANFYAWDAASGETAFIGEVGEDEGGFGSTGLWARFGTWGAAYPVPVEGGATGGDGHLLFFPTTAPLAAGDADEAEDLYRYDAEAHTLERVSVAGPGGSDGGEFAAGALGGKTIGTDYAEFGRWVSDDGETAVFTTEEPLLGGDLNANEDAYMWRDGQVYRLPGGAPAGLDAQRLWPVISADGSSVATHTSRQLLASDGDSVDDVYALRANGGYPEATASVCRGEACQGAPAAAPAAAPAGSGLFAGAGNVREARSCAGPARRARRWSRSATRLRRAAQRAARAGNPRRAVRLRRRAKALAKRARRQSNAAKRCRRAARAASASRRAGR
jgi:hypothetical protein